VAVIGYFAIPVVFGSDFARSSQILLVHALAMPFVFMGTAYIRWLLVEKFMSLFLVTQGVGAVANIILNLALIPIWGGMGAAVATVLSYVIALHLSLYIAPKTRPIFHMMSSALFMPWKSAQRAYALRLELR
jgi:O-antigen/teichoic acid export membrane protein